MRILAIFLLLPLAALADESQLVKQFFNQEGIEDKQAVYAGEMLENYLDTPTLGEFLPEGIEINLRVLEKTTQREVYAVLLSKDGVSQDWYVYLVNSKNKWKISAARQLALPNVFFIVFKEVQGKSNRTKDEEYQYQNMQLTLQTDSELKGFLNKNIDRLNSIAREAESNLDEATESAKNLYFNNVVYDKKSHIVDVQIGGILDNSVGYFFVPTGSEVPTMSPDNYIYIEHVTDNWYVYKTT